MVMSMKGWSFLLSKSALKYTDAFNKIYFDFYSTFVKTIFGTVSHILIQQMNQNHQHDNDDDG